MAEYEKIRVMTPELTAVAILAEDLGIGKSYVSQFVSRHKIKAYNYVTLVIVNKKEFMDAWNNRTVGRKKSPIIYIRKIDLHYNLSVEKNGEFEQVQMHLQYKTDEQIQKYCKENYPKHKLIWMNT